MKSVNIKKWIRFGNDMLVFNIEQLNFYNDSWINSKYDFSKYLSHQNTGYILISVAFLASHSCIKLATIKQINVINGARSATLTRRSMLLGG